MRKYLTIAALGLTLAGCATGATWQDNLARIVAEVGAITRQACGFVPLAQTVTAIVAAGQFTAPFAIANAICAAVTNPATGLRRVPTVSGVPVQGYFVGRR